MGAELIFVTGASGFLGSHIVAELLRNGYNVRAAFRSVEKATAFEKFFEATKLQTCIVPDITADSAYDGLLNEVKGVIHSASPYTFAIGDLQRDLIDPAVKGTNVLLDAVLQTSSIQRVVITSSFAAVIDSAGGSRAGFTYTEHDWNPITEPQSLASGLAAYQASKTFAERAAWNKLSASEIDLVTVCPPLIFGPVHPAAGISATNANESSAQLLAQSEAQTPMPTRMPVFVDVRDVAAIHIAALDATRVQGSQRFLVCGGNFTWQAIKDIRQGGAVQKDKVDEVREQFYQVSTEKVEGMLSVEWTPLEKTVRDALLSLGVSEGQDSHERAMM